ncbi:16S rRNA (cytosine(1402)-N(4))-methyltransferase RsmH [Asticcacaulis sp. AND118]|uniref:16S rRNA (cytosine(1402)-N(4))-methyltransferase RsmH n=1 Tax=Asticcacaulis sp. AND118 TaxID=2840468 RepID=UPI001CFF9973|nr:16S rRNA (cytosine(1402)-N(4))-methyltransferase RsmH [Asticcacaulis sp. AND118]UDF02984.1 16S rRNA (cytosine(1402)-N(4))-methyltransferase RsmH [Asticcacaulis sp. AND118]
MSEFGSEAPHISVLLNEVVAAVAPEAGRVVVDGTFGAGGYTRAFLERGAEVIAFDRDARVLPFVDGVRGDFPDRFRFVNRPFSEMVEGLAELGVDQVDAIVLDIGVSSMQLDEADRGFSFMRDGPLDMRMAVDGLSAADIVNDWAEVDIAHIIWLYGEEHRSRAIAAAIVKRRKEEPFARTLDLAAVVEKAVGGRRGDKVHPATKTFQALRIAVNDELGELEAALEMSERLLKPEGVLAVVTFHSLEDRMVKSFLAERAGRTPSGSRHAPQMQSGPAPTYRLDKARAVAPSEAELSVNPRARSAKLRAAHRTVHPPFSAPSKASPSRRAVR